jgi:hypothetical protein
MAGEITTIKLSKETVKALNQLKIHPRQSYEEVIIKLLTQEEQSSSVPQKLKFSEKKNKSK